jgi:hypothetical protein
MENLSIANIITLISIAMLVAYLIVDKVILPAVKTKNYKEKEIEEFYNNAELEPDTTEEEDLSPISAGTQMILGLLDSTKFVRPKDIGLTKEQVSDLVEAGVLEKSRNGMIRKVH